MENKIVIVGSGSVGKSVLETLHAQGYNDVIVIDAKEAKERNIAFQPEPIPFVLNHIPELKAEFYIKNKNYINGKKLPRKRRK